MVINLKYKDLNINRYKPIRTVATPSNFVLRLWDSGQSLLAMGRYVAARRELEAAEQQAFRQLHAAVLAGIYLSLLEAGRQIRQLCCDGLIAIITDHKLNRFHVTRELVNSGGVGLMMDTGRKLDTHSFSQRSVAKEVAVEFLRLVSIKGSWYLTPMGGRYFVVPVIWTTDPEQLIVPAAPENLIAILPPPGIYRPGDPHHAQARETLFLVWEALALGYLARRHQQRRDGWAELAVLRQARKIDPACERILMQMITLAESLRVRV